MSINFLTNQGNCLFPFQERNRKKRILLPFCFSPLCDPPQCALEQEGVLTGGAGWYVLPQFVITILSHMGYLFCVVFLFLGLKPPGSWAICAKRVNMQGRES